MIDRDIEKETNLSPLYGIYGDMERITRVFHSLIIIMLVGLVAGILISLSTHTITRAIFISLSILPVLASLYLVRRKKFELNATLLAILMISLVTLTATEGMGVHHISILGYPAILIVASLVVRKRVMVLLTLYNILCVAWLVFGELSGLYTPNTLVRSVTGDFYSVSIILISTAIMIRLLSESFFQSNKQLQNELRERKSSEEKREILIKELETRNQETEILRESLASVVGTFEFSEIVERILDQMKKVIPFDTASLWRIEGDRQKLIIGRNLPPEVPPDLEFPNDESNSAYPILNGNAPYVLNTNVQEELKDFQTPPHTYIQSWLAVPLKRRGTIVGLFNLDGTRKNQFDKHHADLAVAFANQVAIVLENSRLFSELQSELRERKQIEANLRQRESILEVVAEAANRLLKASDWHSEIDGILEKLGVTINASHAYIFEIHSSLDGSMVKSMRFEWTDSRSESDLENPRYLNHSINAHDFRTWLSDMNNGVPLVGDHKRLGRDDFQVLTSEGMMALLDVPIHLDGSWWGIIGFDDMHVAREWTSAEIDALVVAANVLGAAIQRQQADIQLQEELEQRKQLIAELAAKNAEAEIIRESAASVALSLDFNETASRILDQLQRVVPYDSASVQLLIGNELEIIGGRGFPEGKDATGIRFVLNEDDPAYPILRDGLPYVLYPDIQSTTERFKGFFHDHIHSWMAIPLYARGRLIGMFALDGFVVNKFTEAHARFASIFANQVAVTLENSRLYSELQSELKKQIALRSAITAISSSLNLSEVLSEICRQMASTIDTTSAYLSKYNPSYSYYTVVAEYLSPYVNELEQVSDLGVSYQKKDGVWMFDETSKIASAIIHADDPDLTPWARNNLLSFGAKSVLYIPLYVQGRLIGHAELWESRRKRVFTDEEISFCQGNITTSRRCH